MDRFAAPWFDLHRRGAEGASILQVRAEDLRVDFDKLERRCRSAEREVVAQKELIEVRKADADRGAVGENGGGNCVECDVS